MRTVATFTNLADAAVAQSVLEDAGIGARCDNVESSVNLSGGPPAIGLMVAEEDFAAAKEILHSGLQSENAVEANQAPGLGSRLLRRIADWVAGL